MKKLLALLLAAAMVLSLAACGKEEPEETGSSETTESTGTTESTTPLVSYTGSDADVLAANDTVVATVGDAELTSGLLQIYYRMSVYGFLSEYSYYLSYFGLDYTQPLDEQECSGFDGTWQQYFLEDALDCFHSYQSLAFMAQETNTPMLEDLQDELDNLYADMSEAVTEGGYESLDDMVQTDIGPGCTYEDYRSYLTTYYAGYSYYTAMCEAMNITDDMIENYFTEHESELSDSGITKDSGDYCDVRHILVLIEGGTEDEEGNVTYSDDEWETCRVEAQNLLDQWLAGEHTEETFAEFANTYSEDTGSNTNGGLYEGLSDETNFVPEFKDWYLDESRQVGDYGLVKSSYGYHIMYFSGAEAQWIAECRSAVESELISAFIDEAMEKYTLTVDYDKIILGDVDLSSMFS